MEMHQKIISKMILFVITTSFYCCGGFKYTIISKEKDCKISYIDSKKIGKRVNIDLVVNNDKNEYNIYLGYKGVPIYIIKTTSKKIIKNDGMDDYRNTYLLVTDTLNDNPSYLGNEVNGHYQISVPYPNINNAKKIIIPINSTELNVLKKTKYILSNRNVEFQIADSTVILGWFKYDF